MSRRGVAIVARRLLAAGESALAATASCSAPRVGSAYPALLVTSGSSTGLAWGCASPASAPAAARGVSSSTVAWATGGGAAPVLRSTQVAQAVLQAADPTDLSTITPLLASVEPTGIPAVSRAAAVSGITDKAFVDELVALAVKNMQELDAADVCSVVESLSEMSCFSLTLKDALAARVLDRLPQFSGDMLGHTLRAFATMQYYDDELLEAVVSHVAANPGSFSAENIADVVYAISKCGFCHPDLVGLVERAAGLLLEEAPADGGEALANILDAYSRVGCSESGTVDALLARIVADPGAMDGPALAKIVVAVVRLGYEGDGVLVPLLNAVAQRLPELPAKAIVKMVHVLGELGYPHQVLMDAVTDSAIPSRMHEFHSEGLADLVASLNKMGYYNNEFMSRMKEASGRKGDEPAPA